MFILQGLSWLTRKAIGLATVVVCTRTPTDQSSFFQLSIKEYKTENDWHIDITSVAAGVSTTQEDRTLDWQERDHQDKVFGKVKGRSRFFKAGEFVMEGPGGEEDAVWLRGEKNHKGEDTKFLDNQHVQSWARSIGNGWTAEQVWGFEDINGERRYTRRVVVRKGDKVQRVRLVYDYKGPLENKSEEDGLAYGE